MTNEEKVELAIVKLATASETVERLVKENNTGFAALAMKSVFDQALAANKAILAAKTILEAEEEEVEEDMANAFAALEPAETIIDALLEKYGSMKMRVVDDAKAAAECVGDALDLLEHE
jgi:hypothetical protein